jgi:hypothetical protein
MEKGGSGVSGGVKGAYCPIWAIKPWRSPGRDVLVSNVGGVPLLCRKWKKSSSFARRC